MSFTYPLTPPASPLPMLLNPKPFAVVGGTPSPFTRYLQTQVHQGQQWVFDAVYPSMTADESAEWEGFLLKCNGRQGTFYFGDDTRPTPRGSAATAPATPLVKGASQSGNALVCDGAPNNAPAYLKTADYISLGAGVSMRLYKVLTDTATDGSGNFTVDIWPKLQVTPADNDPVTVVNCKGLFRRTGNVMPWSVELGPFFGHTLEVESVV